jgi:hypothetical protein
MTRLIGARCKHRKVLSRSVLIARILLGNLKITNNSVLLNEINELNVLAWWLDASEHPFSFRTRQLSLVVPMILERGK